MATLHISPPGHLRRFAYARLLAPFQYPATRAAITLVVGNLAPYARLINEKMPNGLLGWMLQAVSEHTRCLTGDTSIKDISLWNLGLDGNGHLTVQ